MGSGWWLRAAPCPEPRGSAAPRGSALGPLLLNICSVCTGALPGARDGIGPRSAQRLLNHIWTPLLVWGNTSAGKDSAHRPRFKEGPGDGAQDLNARKHFCTVRWQSTSTGCTEAAEFPLWRSPKAAGTRSWVLLWVSLLEQRWARSPERSLPTSTIRDSGSSCAARRELQRDRGLLSPQESFDPAAAHQLPRGGYAQPEPGSARCFKQNQNPQAEMGVQAPSRERLSPTPRLPTGSAVSLCAGVFNTNLDDCWIKPLAAWSDPTADPTVDLSGTQNPPHPAQAPPPTPPVPLPSSPVQESPG